MSACEFVGSNVDFYVPLVLKRADLFLAADLFLECLVPELFYLQKVLRCSKQLCSLIFSDVPKRTPQTRIHYFLAHLLSWQSFTTDTALFDSPSEVLVRVIIRMMTHIH